MAKRNLEGARYLLTGASSGIGRALAMELARRGAKLFVTARREERLEELAADAKRANGRVLFATGDITDSQFRESLVAKVLKEWQGSLDGLINAAGVGYFGDFPEATANEIEATINVDVIAPLELARLCIPALAKGTKPLIINIGSVLGHVPAPRKAAYVASKFAIRGFSDSLRMELAPKGIDVLHVSPSTTATEFFDIATDDNQLKTKMLKRAMSPEQVAIEIVAGIRHGKRELVLSAGGRWLVRLHHFFPRFAERLMARFAD
jgi:short-subunit dehydrogenase